MADNKKDHTAGSVSSSVSSTGKNTAVAANQSSMSAGAGSALGKASAAGNVALMSNPFKLGGLVNSGSFHGPVAAAGDRDLQQETFGKSYTDVARGLAQALGQDRWANRDNLEAQQAQENQFIQQIIDHGKATMLPGGFSTDGMNKSQDPIKLGTGKTGGAGVNGSWDGVPSSDLRPKNGGTSKQSEFGPWDWSQGSMNRAAGINKASQDLRAQNATWPGMADKIYEARDIQNQRMAEAKANDFTHAFAPRIADPNNPGAYTPTPPSHYYDVKPTATGDLNHLQTNVTELLNSDSGIAKHDPYNNPVSPSQREAQLKADTTFSPSEERAIRQLPSRQAQGQPPTMEELAAIWAKTHPNDPSPQMFLNKHAEDRFIDPILDPIREQAQQRQRAAHPLRAIDGINKAHPLRGDQGMNDRDGFPNIGQQHQLDIAKNIPLPGGEDNAEQVQQGMMPKFQLHAPEAILRGFRRGPMPLDTTTQNKQLANFASGTEPMVPADHTSGMQYSQLNGLDQPRRKDDGLGILAGVVKTFMGGLIKGKMPTDQMEWIRQWQSGNRINQDIDPAIEGNLLKAALDKENAVTRRNNKVGVDPIQQNDVGPVAVDISEKLPRGKSYSSEMAKTEASLRSNVLRKATPMSEGPDAIKTSGINDSTQHAFLAALDMYKNAIKSAGNDSGYREAIYDRNNNTVVRTPDQQERRQRRARQAWNGGG